MDIIVDSLIEILISPSSIMTWFFILMLVSYFLKYKRFSIASGTIALTIFFVFGCGPVSQLILSSLEYQYPQYQSDEPASNSISAIVLLTGGADLKPDAPISSHINKSSAYRLLEARRIYQLNPEVNILVTGLGVTPGMLKKVLVSMDVPEDIIQLDNQSATTYESAINNKIKLSNRSFILVTSAGHMPRAMAVFKRQGLDPIPAPTEYLTRKNIFSPQYLPSPKHLTNSDLAIHEYLGIFWYWITDRI